VDHEEPDRDRTHQFMARITAAIGPVSGLLEIAERVNHLITVIVTDATRRPGGAKLHTTGSVS
jgi:hypothetical protein